VNSHRGETASLCWRRIKTAWREGKASAQRQVCAYSAPLSPEFSVEAATMSIGPDVLVFISATRALIQSLRQHPLTDEELAELECCLRELAALIPLDQTRHPA
jgi:hypothetical protein